MTLGSPKPARDVVAAEAAAVTADADGKPSKRVDTLQSAISSTAVAEQAMAASVERLAGQIFLTPSAIKRRPRRFELSSVAALAPLHWIKQIAAGWSAYAWTDTRSTFHKTRRRAKQ